MMHCGGSASSIRWDHSTKPSATSILLRLVGDYLEKVADIKRELGAVYLGWKDYGAAERVLGEACRSRRIVATSAALL